MFSRISYAEFLIIFLILQIGDCAKFFKPFNVTYDHRSLIIHGRRRMLISAGMHYPRATPDMWSDLIAKGKAGGADVIQTYVFWNGHEPIRGQYKFEGRYDIVKFVKLVGTSGLYLHLRIGPYVCAEWNFGGFPVWLRDIPGIQFRTDNEPFKEEMARFVKKIVDLMRQARLFSWQGGPIILLQIENEYGNVEKSFGAKGKNYVKWAAKMALDLDVGVPWVMCRQTDAPEFIIDSCNGFYCDGFRPNSYKKPSLWTEDWNGWYTSWGSKVPHRPVEDNAFAVARFFERGGSFQNYYMFFGGTNFGHTAGGLYITSYDYDAPIDEYGLLSQPKWGHLKDLHLALKLCEPALIAVDSGPQYIKLGPKQEAHVYHLSPDAFENGGHCSAFLANIDEVNSVTVKFHDRNYNLPPWSVSILPDCKNVAFNTAKVGAQTSIKTTNFHSLHSSNISRIGNLLLPTERCSFSATWMSFKESVGAWGDSNFTTNGILEHLNLTKDNSDYLWYIARIYVSDEDSSFWKENNTLPLLVIEKMRDVVRIFVNGELSGSAVGHWVGVKHKVRLIPGYNELAILSETVGLQNYGAFLEKDGAGFRGRIKLLGMKNGELNLSNSYWTYQIGLKGEYLKIYTFEGHKNVEWIDLPQNTTASSLTWYKTSFNAPGGKDPISLYLGSMGKGEAWINGHSIGRYWSLAAPRDGCQTACNYRGAYNENKCAINCGQNSQNWYHIPRSWLQQSNNLLVLFEEIGGNPLDISIKLHHTRTICAKVSESHYPPIHLWSNQNFLSGNFSLSNVSPEMQLQCDDGHIISNVTFASFGTPRGDCQKFKQGKCHAPGTLTTVTEACKGQNSCTVRVWKNEFGDDPCRGVVKTLAVQAECISASTASIQ